MDCNKEEALRAKEIAEKKMENRDFVGARKFALKAQRLYPVLENIAQMLVVCDVHCSAEQKVFGDEINWYGVLQLERTAGDAMIKKQFRKFALQLHPDKNKFAGAEAAFKLIGEAQRVLSDREKRARYDMKLNVNKTAMPPRSTQPKVPTNFNSAMKNNVRPNFTNSNTQQQQQNKQPPQQQNGVHRTFWTACPFCSVKYEYYREILNKSIRCQQCHRLFVAYILDMQGTSPTTNPSQQASKANVGSQGNSHAEKSNTKPFKKKVPVGVSRKPDVKRKRNQVEEFSQSSDSTSSSDSEDEIVAGKNGFPGVGNHSTEQPRRSVRQKHNVSYSDNMNGTDNDLLRPSKRGQENGSHCGDGQSHGETAKTNDQNGLAPDPKDEHEKVKQKHAEKIRAGGKEAAEGSKQMDKTIEHSSLGSTSKTSNCPNAYVYPDAEFSDFDKDRKKECFAPGQIWAIYDSIDGMPRFYALIRKVLSPGFQLQATWLEPHPDDNDEIKWVDEELPVACGKFKLCNTEIIEDHLTFSHLVMFKRNGRNTFQVYPRKGETWALFKNWDITWYKDVESHRQYEYEFVEILSDYVEGEGVYVAYLGKLKGFVSIFIQTMKEDNQPFQIPSKELFRFSHRIPSFKMTGQEGVGVHLGYLEFDPASLPMNLEEIAVTQNLDVKTGHSSCGSENARTSKRSKPSMSPEDIVSIPKVKVETSNLTEVKDSLDDMDDCHASASTPEAFEIPDAQFFNFESGRSLDKFQVGQIWAFYSDEDGMPKYYGQIKKVVTSPTIELHVYWLACCWLPENTTKWEDDGMLTSCGRFKVLKTKDFLSIYNNLSCISHQVQADPIGKNYTIYPRKGEVWALYRKWSNKIKSSDLKNWEYDIVEVLEVADLFIETSILEHVTGFSSVFRGESIEGSSGNLRIPRKELLRFSHQIPAFKLTEEHGDLRGFWELDPGALPPSFLWP